MNNNRKLISMMQELLTELTEADLGDADATTAHTVNALKEQIQSQVRLMQDSVSHTEEVRQMYRHLVGKLEDIQTSVAVLKTDMMCKKKDTENKELPAPYPGQKDLHALKADLDMKLKCVSSMICSSEESLYKRLNTMQTSFTSQFGLLDRYMSDYARPRLIKCMLGIQVLLVLLYGVGILIVKDIIL
jgi:hypothetical protein